MTSRIVLSLVAIVALFIGIGMLPGGKIDGVYRGLAQDCMCDSVNFMRFRDGKVIMYRSSHPPADLIGRYERNADGSVDVFMDAWKEGETEKLIFTAKPRLWFTRFKDSKGNSGSWHRKRQTRGLVQRTIRQHEVLALFVSEDRTIHKTFYDSALSELRTEIQPPRSKRREDDEEEAR